ncbi:hypothetical protein RB195_020232 [Necator americanus]|uniref:Uncharacterized protein n=2 Tax=Necator americanus TaxID=51031 RepID=A0ABR1CLE5_NECAM
MHHWLAGTFLPHSANSGTRPVRDDRCVSSGHVVQQRKQPQFIMIHCIALFVFLDILEISGKTSRLRRNSYLRPPYVEEQQTMEIQPTYDWSPQGESFYGPMMSPPVPPPVPPPPTPPMEWQQYGYAYRYHHHHHHHHCETCAPKPPPYTPSGYSSPPRYDYQRPFPDYGRPPYAKDNYKRPLSGYSNPYRGGNYQPSISGYSRPLSVESAHGSHSFGSVRETIPAPPPDPPVPPFPGSQVVDTVGAQNSALQGTFGNSGPAPPAPPSPSQIGNIVTAPTAPGSPPGLPNKLVKPRGMPSMIID